MGLLTILGTLLLFLCMGFGYCKGWDYVKKTSPDHLVHYYLVMAFVRFAIVAVLVLAYIKLSGEPRAVLIQYSLMTFAMYVLMMIVTMRLRHN